VKLSESSLPAAQSPSSRRRCCRPVTLHIQRHHLALDRSTFRALANRYRCRVARANGNGTVLVGDASAASCEPGSPTPTYSWRINSYNMSDANFSQTCFSCPTNCTAPKLTNGRVSLRKRHSSASSAPPAHSPPSAASRGRTRTIQRWRTSCTTSGETATGSGPHFRLRECRAVAEWMASTENSGCRLRRTTGPAPHNPILKRGEAITFERDNWRDQVTASVDVVVVTYRLRLSRRPV